jgi:hypothetical protein
MAAKSVRIPIEKKPGENVAYREYTPLGEGAFNRTEVRIGPETHSFSFRTIHSSDYLDLTDMEALAAASGKYPAFSFVKGHYF